MIQLRVLTLLFMTIATFSWSESAENFGNPFLELPNWRGHDASPAEKNPLLDKTNTASGADQEFISTSPEDNLNLFYGALSVIDDQEKMNLAKKIAHMEYGDTGGLGSSGITMWNSGEDFLSLGIGHFLWMPEKLFEDSPYQQSFKSFLEYYVERFGLEAIPAQLQKLFFDENGQVKAMPWNSKKEFDAQFDSGDLVAIRSFLNKKENVIAQVDFILDRMKKNIAQIVKESKNPEGTLAYITELTTEGGDKLFPLIDYVNFKGDGLSPEDKKVVDGKEIRWGLKQVLELAVEKKNDQPDRKASDIFPDAAVLTLSKRPDYQKWREGWRSRIYDNYTVK